MATNNESVKWLYGKLKSQGYNIGSEDKFASLLANKDARDWCYEKATEMGLNVGTTEQFEKLVSPHSEAAVISEPANPTTPAKPTAPQPAAAPAQSQAGFGTRLSAGIKAGVASSLTQGSLTTQGAQLPTDTLTTPQPAVRQKKPDLTAGGRGRTEQVTADKATADYATDTVGGAKEDKPTPSFFAVPLANARGGKKMNRKQIAQFDRKLENAKEVASHLGEDGQETIDNILEYSKRNKSTTGGQTVISGQVVDPVTGKIETEYLTPTGSRTTDKAAADQMSRQYRQAVAATDMSVGAQLRRAQWRLKAVEEKLMARGKQLLEEHEKGKQDGFTGFMQDFSDAALADRMGGATGVTPEDYAEFGEDREYQALRLQKRKLEEEVQRLSNARSNQMNDDGFWKNYIRSTGQSLFKIDGWDFGKNAQRDAQTMIELDRRIKNGEELTEEEDDVLNELYLHSNVMDAFGDLGAGDSFGNITGTSFSFMKDFYLTGGFSGITTKLPIALTKRMAFNAAKRMGSGLAGKRLALELSKNGLMATVRAGGRQAIPQIMASQGKLGLAGTLFTKALGVGAEDLLIRAPLMAGTVQGATTAAKIIETKLGKVEYDAEKGQLRFANDKTWGSAAWETAADAVIENFSEMWGGHLPAVSDVTKAFGARKLTAAILRSTREGAGTVLSKTNKFLTRAGVNGYFGEVGEEYYGQLWRTMLNLESARDGMGRNNFESGKFHGDIWGGMALSIGMTSASTLAVNYGAKGAVSAYSMSKYLAHRHQLNRSAARAATLFDEGEWDTLREIVDLADNATMCELARQTMQDPDMAKNQKEALMDYMEKSMIFRGYNLGEMLNQRNGAQQSQDQRQLDESYLDGYNTSTSQEILDARNMVEHQRKRLEAELSGLDEQEIDNIFDDVEVNPVEALQKTFDEKLRDIILDYANAKAVYDGMMQRREDDVDSQIAQSDAAIDAMVNVGSGMIHPASMKAGNRAVAVVSGNLVLNDDGTVNEEESDATLIVRDSKTGKLEFTYPGSILSGNSPLDATREKEAAAELIRQNAGQRAGVSHNDTPSFADGEEIEVINSEGSAETLTIIQTYADTASDSSEEMVEVENAAGERMSYPKSILQKWAEDASRVRVENYEHERGSDKNEQTEDAARFSLNDEFTIRDDQGRLIFGIVTREADNDGMIEIQTDQPLNGQLVSRLSVEDLAGMLVSDDTTPEDDTTGTAGESRYKDESFEIEDDVVIGGQNGKIVTEADGKLTVWTPERLNENSYEDQSVSGFFTEFTPRELNAAVERDEHGRALGTRAEARTEPPVGARAESAESETEIPLRADGAGTGAAMPEGGLSSDNAEHDTGYNSVGAEVAAEWLLSSGAGAITASDYLLKALSGVFPNAKEAIEAIRRKYSEQINAGLETSEINNFVHTPLFDAVMREVSAAVVNAYNNKTEAQSILDIILGNPTGLPGRLGQETSLRLESLHSSERREPEQEDKQESGGESLPQRAVDRLPRSEQGVPLWDAPDVDAATTWEALNEVAPSRTRAEFMVVHQQKWLAEEMAKLGKREPTYQEPAPKGDINAMLRAEKAADEKFAADHARWESEMAELQRRAAHWRRVDELIRRQDKEAEEARKRQEAEVRRRVEEQERLAAQQREEERQRSLAEHERRQAEERAWFEANRERIEAQQAEAEAEEARRQAEREDMTDEERRAWEAEKRSFDKKLRDVADEVRDSEAALEVLRNTDPQSVDEVAALLLATHKIIWKSVYGPNGTRIITGADAYSGLGEAERRRLMGMWANRERGGISIDRLAEDKFQEMCEVYGIPYDNATARDALIDVIRSSATRGSVTNYITERRMEQARRIAEQERHFREAADAAAESRMDRVEMIPDTRDMGELGETLPEDAVPFHRESTAEPTVGTRTDKAESTADRRPVYELGVDLVRSAGVPVVEVSGEEARAVLEHRGGDVQLMGSRTDRKMESIGRHFEGRELDANTQTVVDVFSGKRDNVAIEVERTDGKVRVVMRQGKEPKAGTKHSLFRHFETESNYITADDIAMIPEIIAKGERTVDGKKISYGYVTADGIRLRVTTESNDKSEVFTNFYTNRKTSKVKSSSVANNAVGTRHHSGAQSLNPEVSAAKVDNNSHSDKKNDRKFLRTPSGEVYGWTVGGKVYLNRDAMNPETPVHEYTHLWDRMVRERKPELWERGKELLRQTDLWRQVEEDPNYADIRGDEDAVASEVHSRLTGRDGARLLAEMLERAGRRGLVERAQATTLLGKIRQWMGDMFAELKSTLGKWSKRDLQALTLEDFNNMTLRDLAEGIDPRNGDKNLVAVHNLSEKNLAQALELGGFPMPSIAVTKAGTGHSSFGRISLVFARDSVDPARRGNRVYGRDAWTPTFPSVGYKLSDAKTSEIYARANGAGRLPLFRAMDFHPDSYGRRIDERGDESLVESFADDYSAKQLFLSEKGRPVEKFEEHEVEKYSADNIALYEKMLDRIGADALRNESPETLEPKVRQLISEHRGIDFSTLKPLRAKALVDGSIRKALDYAENGNLKTEIDTDATRAKIDERIDPEEYKAWLRETFSGVVENKGIRNERDRFTPSGVQRKWEALYDALTLDNVTNFMLRQAKKGGKGLFGSNIFGAAAREFGSIDEIRSEAARHIKSLSNEEYEAEGDRIISRLKNISLPSVSDNFSDAMDFVQNVTEAVANSKSAAEIYRSLKKTYPDMTMDVAHEIADIVSDIQKMSTRYFEAKPQRAVGFEEVKLAVVPEGTSQELISRLESRGIPVKTYKEGNEQQRSEIISRMTSELDLRFHAAMARGHEDFDSMRERAVEERGIVMPGLNEKSVRVVEVPRHDFEGDRPIGTARKWAKENIVGEHTLIDSEGNEVPYTISGGTVDKYLSKSAISKSDNLGVHLSVLKKLPEVISESIEAESHPDYIKGTDGKRHAENGYSDNIIVHRFYGAVEISGEKYRVKTTILESANNEKNKPHSFEVSNVELVEETAGLDGRKGTDTYRPRYSETSSEKGISGNAGSIPATKLLKGVEKSYDPGVKLLEASENSSENIARDPGGVRRSRKVGGVSLFDRRADEGVQRALFDDTPAETAPAQSQSLLDRALDVAHGREVEKANGVIEGYAERYMEYADGMERRDQRMAQLEQEIEQHRAAGTDNREPTVGMEAEAELDALRDEAALEDASMNEHQAEAVARLSEFYRSLGNTPEDAERMAIDRARQTRAEVEIRRAQKASREWLASQADGALNSRESDGRVVATVETAGGDRIGVRSMGGLPKLKDGDFALVERRFVADGMFTFDGRGRIESVDDVAYIFRKLEDFAQEHSFVVMQRADGSFKVVHTGMGNAVCTMVDMSAVRAAYEAFGARKIWFVHNHPSGTLSFSIADVQMIRRMQDAFADEVETLDAIIIDTRSGEYVTYNDRTTGSTHASRSEAEIGVEMFGGKKFADDYNAEGMTPIVGAGAIARYVADLRLGDGVKSGYLILDHGNKVMANIVTEGNTDTAALAHEMAAAAIRYGGTRVVRYSNGEISDARSMSGSELMELKNMVERLSMREVTLLDNVDMLGGLHDGGNYSSAFDNGLLREGDAGYGSEREQETIEVQNKTFNSELDRWTSGTMQSSEHITLGKPTGVIAGFVPDAPLILRQSVLTKARKKHSLSAAELKNLPGSIARPIFVFQSKNNSLGVLTEIKAENGKNIFVAIEIGVDKQLGHQILTVNDILSIHDRDIENIVMPIVENNSLRYVDKSKGLDWLSSAKTNSQAIASETFDVAAKIVKDFENPTLSDSKSSENYANDPGSTDAAMATDEQVLERKGDGYGAYTDGEISYANDPASRVMGKNRFSRKRQAEFAERERRRMAERVREIADLLHLDNVEIVTDVNTLEGKRAKAKGFFNGKTGKITIVIPNNISTLDAEQTLLHEAVAHYGLRKLFGERFDTFLDNVYEAAEPRIRHEISALASRNGWNIRTATEEYLAGLAEDMSFEHARESAGWWSRIKSLFLDMLEKIGFDKFRDKTGVELTDNELRYILWRSYQNLANPGRYREFVDEALDREKQYRLQVGEYAESGIEAELVAEAQGNKAIRIDQKDKGRELIDSLRMNPVEAERIDLNLDDAAKIVENFENPSIEDQKNTPEDEYLYRPGDFSPRDQVDARDWYERMVSRSGWQFKEAVQDSMLGLRTFYHAILGKQTRIEDIPGYENAYLFENRLSSMNAAQQHQYFQQYMRPLLQEIGKLAGANKRKRNELTYYLMAKHGLERNEYMRNEAAANGEETDRDFAGLCGLTGGATWIDAEEIARQWVDDYESQHDTASLWTAINNATKATLEKVYLSGQLSKDSYEKIRDMYQYYVPLRGWDETTSDEVYGYLMSKDGPLGGSIMRKAAGRTSMADDPIATIAMMADDAIRQGNRNQMKQCFLNFVLNHPSDLASVSNLWLEYDTVYDEWIPVFADINPNDTAETVDQKIRDFEERMEALRSQSPDKYKRGREAQDIPYKVVNRNLKEHQVMVKRGGMTYVITVNGNPRAAQAINGLTNPDVEVGGVIGNLLKVGEYINRQLSALYTTRNPGFIASNFLRDMIYSNSMAWVKESPRYARAYHLNFGKFAPLSPRRFARLRKGLAGGTVYSMGMLMRKWESGTLNTNDKYERYFYEFMTNGGETGYTSVRDIKKHKRIVAAELKKQGSIGRKAWSALGAQLDLLNRSVENCARFAAFVTSREFGRSVDRSVYDAKEVSVNFNKKGSGSRMLDTAGQRGLGKIGGYLGGLGKVSYVFWNAGLQGMTNYGRQAKRHPLKFSAGVAALFTLGYLVPLLAQMMSGDGDDEDDMNAYYNLAEHVRRQNVTFKAGGQWISIPLPVEFRAIYGLGELACGVICGNEHYSNEELAMQIAAQVSQVMPLDMLEGGGGISPFIPSGFKPFTEAYIMNKSWTGLPIYKDTPFNKNDPEWTKAYSNANTHLVEFSRWLNATTGGNDFKKGAIDLNPAKLEYFLSGMLGGAATFPNELYKAGETAAGAREFEWRNIPVLNRVVKSGDERTAYRKLQNEYFKYKEEYIETGRLRRKYENAADRGLLEYAQAKEFLERSPEYARWMIFSEFKEDLDAYQEAIAAETDTETRTRLEVERFELMRKLVNALRNPDKYLKETTPVDK